MSKKLVEVLKINKYLAISLVDTFFEEICTLFEQGRQIRLAGFGKFKLRDKRERPGRNPKTGKDVMITPRRVVTFRAGLKLMDRINSKLNFIFRNFILKQSDYRSPRRKDTIHRIGTRG